MKISEKLKLVIRENNPLKSFSSDIIDDFKVDVFDNSEADIDTVRAVIDGDSYEEEYPVEGTYVINNATDFFLDKYKNKVSDNEIKAALATLNKSLKGKRVSKLKGYFKYSFIGGKGSDISSSEKKQFDFDISQVIYDDKKDILSIIGNVKHLG